MPSSDHFEIPAEMRDFAERSFEQARFAFDKFMDATQSTMNTFEGQSKVAQAAATEVSKKIMNFDGTSALFKLAHHREPFPC